MTGSIDWPFILAILQILAILSAAVLLWSFCDEHKSRPAARNANNRQDWQDLKGSRRRAFAAHCPNPANPANPANPVCFCFWSFR
jgi:hypothetical protein